MKCKFTFLAVLLLEPLAALTLAISVSEARAEDRRPVPAADQVQTATTVGNWQILQDGISGTGSDITVTDNRPLSGLTAVYYRIYVY